MANDIELSRLGIARIATSILRNSGLAKCSRTGCKDSENIRQKQSATRSLEQVDNHGLFVLIYILHIGCVLLVEKHVV